MAIASTELASLLNHFGGWREKYQFDISNICRIVSDHLVLSHRLSGKLVCFEAFAPGKVKGGTLGRETAGFFPEKKKKKETVVFFQRIKKNSFRLNSASKSANNFTFYHKKPLANMLVRSQ